MIRLVGNLETQYKELLERRQIIKQGADFTILNTIISDHVGIYLPERCAALAKDLLSRDLLP